MFEVIQNVKVLTHHWYNLCRSSIHLLSFVLPIRLLNDFDNDLTRAGQWFPIDVTPKVRGNNT